MKHSPTPCYPGPIDLGSACVMTHAYVASAAVVVSLSVIGAFEVLILALAL